MTQEETLALVGNLAAICRQNNIHRVKVGEVEIEFAGDTVDPAAIKAFQSFMDKGMPTDEEVLFHSAPGGPTEPRRQKE